MVFVPLPVLAVASTMSPLTEDSRFQAEANNSVSYQENEKNVSSTSSEESTTSPLDDERQIDPAVEARARRK